MVVRKLKQRQTTGRVWRVGTTAVLNRAGLTKKETSEQKPGSDEGVSHEDVRALRHSLFQTRGELCAHGRGWGEGAGLSNKELLWISRARNG